MEDNKIVSMVNLYIYIYIHIMYIRINSKFDNLTIVKSIMYVVLLK